VTGWRDTAAFDTPTLQRRGLLALAGLGLAGTATELVFLRHWSGATQLIVWPAIAALAIAFVAVARRASPSTVRAARSLAGLVVVIALAGVALHVLENLDAGPLDRHFATTWDGLGAAQQWWLAITGGVGPAPVLAPGALAEISLALLLSTLRHPALAASPAS
jgi:hypothetical protein